MIRRALITACSLLTGLCCLTACAPLGYHAYDNGYAGLSQRLNEAATNNGVMHVVVVHGIGDHAIGYSTNLAAGLASELNLAGQNDFATNALISHAGITNWLLEYSYRDEQRVMRFHEVTWTPTTTNIKVSAFAKDLTLNPHRVPINKALKVDLMDEALPDAVLYMNPDFRPRMQEPIFDTIQRVAKQAGPNDVIVLIASSLGSKMIFDTTVDYENDTNVQRFAERTTDIIMLANQLPLLHLGTGTNIGSANPVADNSTKKFLRLSKQHKQRHNAAHGSPVNSHESIIHVVAATDPNDLLSYPLTVADVVPDDGDSSDVKIAVSNIYSHNAWSILFLFENPEAAHDNYDENGWLLRKLAHGFGDSTVVH